MSSFYGGKCWDCKKAITKTGGSMLLYCTCLILLCQDCARLQLSNRQNTYDSHIICPLCNQATDLASLALDVRKAKDQECRLLKSSFAFYRLKQPSLKRATARSFQKLITLLSSSGFNSKANLLEEKDSKVVSLKVAQMELQRLKKKGCAEGQLDPLSLVSFKSNILIEKVLMSIRGDCSFTVNCKCIVCDEPIKKGRTVLLTCNCRNTHLCVCCVYQILANQEKTYSEGIRCPTCKKASMVLGGVNEAKEAETQLVASAFKYFQIRNIKPKMNEVLELHSLYSMFSTVGMRGTVDPETFYKEEVAHTAKATTVAFLRLEVARLELMRQHNLTSTRENPHLFLGPMSCLRFFEHKFLDVFLEPEVLVPGAGRPAIEKHWRDEPDVIHVVTAPKQVDSNEVREINRELAETILEAYEGRDRRVIDDTSSVGTVHEEEYETDVSEEEDEEDEELNGEESDSDSIHSVKVKGALPSVAASAARKGGDSLLSLAKAHVDMKSSSSSSSVKSADSQLNHLPPLAYASSSSVPSDKVAATAPQVKRSRPILPANISKATGGKQRLSSSDDNAQRRQVTGPTQTPPSAKADSIRKRPSLVVSDDEDTEEELLHPPAKKKSIITTAAAAAAAPVAVQTQTKPPHNRQERHAMDILRDSAMVVNVSSQLHTTSLDISAVTTSLKTTATGSLVTAPSSAPSLWPSLPPDDGRVEPRRSRFEPVYAKSVAVRIPSPPRSSRMVARDSHDDTHQEKRQTSYHPRDDHSQESSHKFHPGDRVEVFTPPDGIFEGIVRTCYDDHTYDIDALDGHRRHDVVENLMRGSSPYGVPSSSSTSESSRKQKSKPTAAAAASSATAKRKEWTVGDRVEVWNQGVWYVGQVDKVRGRGFYDIHYLDGTTESDVDEQFIRGSGGGNNSSPSNAVQKKPSQDQNRGEKRNRSPSRSSSPSPRRYGAARDEGANWYYRPASSSVQQYLERDLYRQRDNTPYSTPLYDRDAYRRGFDYSPSRESHSRSRSRSNRSRRRSSSSGRDRGRSRDRDGYRGRERHSSPSRERHASQQRSRDYQPLSEPEYSSSASNPRPPPPIPTSSAAASSSANITTIKVAMPATAATATAAAAPFPPPPRDLKKPPTPIVHRNERGGVKEHVLTMGIFYSSPSSQGNQPRERLTSFTPAPLPEVKKEERNLRALCKELDFSRMSEYVVVMEAPDQSSLLPASQFIESKGVKSYRFRVRVYFERKVVDKHRGEYPELFKSGIDSSRPYCEGVVTTYSPQSTVGMLKRLLFIQLGFEGTIRDFLGSDQQILNPKLTFAECNILPDSLVTVRPRRNY